MVIAIISLVLLLAAFLVPAVLRDELGKGKAVIVGVVIGALGVSGLISRSFTTIDDDSIGHLTRVYGGSDMNAGQIIASDGQKGPQARILGPGFHFIPLINVLYQVEELPVVEIPQGKYGIVIARDGTPLRDGQFIADGWPEGQHQNYLNASFFLGHDQDFVARGQKGTQLTVLKPGKYRLNHYLFDIQLGDALTIKTGTVAVVRSNVQTNTDEACAIISVKASTTTPVVSKGCIGVWDEALMPGRYYLNAEAYAYTIIPTRLITWSYRGGYIARKINLTVQDDGSIKQSIAETPMETPANAADKAVNVRAEGWTFPVDLRVVAQVTPTDAPIVVATVGTLQRVEDNVVTPTIRDELRTIGGRTSSGCTTTDNVETCKIVGTKVLDFVEKRDVISSQVLSVVLKAAATVGVTIKDVRLGEPAIPPELMVATLREQLAQQLQATYIKEQEAQVERVKVSRQRAIASQQEVLVAAEIAEQAADFYMRKRKKEGEAEKLYLTQVAEGQEKQANVLGKDRVLQLEIAKMSIEAATKNPQIVKVPQVMVNNGGGGSSLEGAAAVLGWSNLTSQLASKEQTK